ncbi:hypothetical protein PRZ48_001063 [Zasmidium cellare]|uniref:RNA polymerase I-specific transcription initiation factor RRN6-like protein n=1 Tax=Zasmidium cellare TaxID=395010 RepID=A0ABR0F1X0_ZASCE|nr:hypothetical protein PRZ48_001063 [Zasmidium cellare]
MAERSKCDLPYGHYGRVQFSLDENNLQFGRNLTTPFSIKALDDQDVLPQPSNAALSQEDTRHPKSSTKELAKQAQALAGFSPEFQPILSRIPRLLKASEAVRNATERHEPTKGNLIAFTKVWSDIRHRAISVAIMPTGDTGSHLRLVQVQRQRRGWTADRASWIEVPTLYGEEARWSSDGGSILQVHSTPGASGRDALLAIRVQSQTHILRPSHTSRTQESALSNLTLSPLYTVGIQQTAGQMHADVAFNPDFGQKLALVDFSGAWTVLEFSSRKMDRVSRTWRGTPQAKQSTKTLTLSDGWARVAWILNLSTLVTCTRQGLCLVTLEPDGAAASKEIDSDFLGSSVPLLDLMVMPGTRDAFAVLTKTHVAIYHVTVKGHDDVVPTCKAKIRHFKSPEDLSLRLSSWTDQDVRDGPFELAFPDVEDGARPFEDIHVQPMEMVTKAGSSAKSERLVEHIRYYAFTALRADHSIFEGMCYGATAQSQTFECPGPPLWVQKFRPATQSRLWKEEFVVQDDTELLDPGEQRSEPVSRRARRPKALLSENIKSVSFELVANALHTSNGPDKSIEDLASEVTAVINTKDIQSAGGHMRTLHSLTDAEIAIEDIQDASVLLQSAFETPSQGAENDDEPEDRDRESRLRFKVDKTTLVGFSAPEDRVAEDDATLASVHDQFISSWVSSLSSKVPGWVRLAKAGIAQRMTAEVFLAAQRLRLQEVKPAATQESQEDNETQEQTWDLPLRASGPVAQSQPTSSRTARYLAQHSALPTPSPTATPSVITASSGSSLTAAPELHRLSKYTTFEKPAPMVLPRPLVKVLSHWEIGKDPDNYDWLSASRHLTQQEEEEAEHDLTERERKRMQRRAERHIMRQRKEAAASQASQMTSSQATEIMSASQPPVLKFESQPAGMPASSQSQGPGPVAASQVVPGRFGGRPPPKKRRKQGF